MISPNVYVSLILAPAIALGMILYFAKKQQKPYNQLLLVSFFSGMLATLILIGAEYLSTISGLNDLRTLKRIFFFSFVTVGFASEFGKYIILKYVIMPRKEVDRPIMAIQLSILVALGFSTTRLAWFILDPFETLTIFPYLLYAFILTPANLIFAVMMGFFVGMAKFLRTRFVFSLTGLFGAAILHGIFNFCLLTRDYKLLSVFAFGSTILVFIFGIKAAFTKPEVTDKI